MVPMSDAGSDCFWSLVWLVHCPAAGCVSRKDSILVRVYPIPELNGSPARMWVLGERAMEFCGLCPLYFVGKCSH